MGVLFLNAISLWVKHTGWSYKRHSLLSCNQWKRYETSDRTEVMLVINIYIYIYISKYQSKINLQALPTFVLPSIYILKMWLTKGSGVLIGSIESCMAVKPIVYLTVDALENHNNKENNVQKENRRNFCRPHLAVQRLQTHLKSLKKEPAFIDLERGCRWLL